jgi:hypothetical protein
MASVPWDSEAAHGLIKCAFLAKPASNYLKLPTEPNSDSSELEHPESAVERGPSPVNSLKWLGDKKIQMWLWAGLAALIAVQVYYVREMLAALFIFAVIFGVGAVVAFILFLFDQASQRTAAWAEPQAKRAARAARRGIVHLEEEISKKIPHRPVGA